MVAACRPSLGDDFMKHIARNLTDPFDRFLKDKRYVLIDRDTNFIIAFWRILKQADVGRADKQLAVEIRHLTGRNDVGITLLFCPSFSLSFKKNSQNAIQKREGSKGQRRLRAKKSAWWITLRRGNGLPGICQTISLRNLLPGWVNREQQAIIAFYQVELDALTKAQGKKRLLLFVEVRFRQRQSTPPS